MKDVWRETVKLHLVRNTRIALCNLVWWKIFCMNFDRKSAHVRVCVCVRVCACVCLCARRASRVVCRACNTHTHTHNPHNVRACVRATDTHTCTHTHTM